MDRIRFFTPSLPCRQKHTRASACAHTTHTWQYLLQYLHCMNRCSYRSFPVSHSSHFPFAVSSSFSTHTLCRCTLYISQMEIPQIYSHTTGSASNAAQTEEVCVSAAAGWKPCISNKSVLFKGVRRPASFSDMLMSFSPHWFLLGKVVKVCVWGWF